MHLSHSALSSFCTSHRDDVTLTFVGYPVLVRFEITHYVLKARII